MPVTLAQHPVGDTRLDEQPDAVALEDAGAYGLLDLGPGSAYGSAPLLVVGGLPQLESSAGGVADVSESPDTDLLDDIALRVDSSVLQLREHRVEIADAEVDHDLLLRPAAQTVGPASCCQSMSP